MTSGLRVMASNLLNGGADLAGRHRAELHAQVVREVDPDVVLVQEARGFLDDGQRLWLVAEGRWGLRGFVGCAPHSGQHTGVFIRPSFTPVSFRVDAAHFHHGASMLIVAVPDAAALITFVSVHLAPTHPDARRAEAAHLAGLAAPGQLVVVGGDCNSPSPHDPPVDLSPLPPHFRVRYAGSDGDADRGAVGFLLDAGFVELLGDESPTVPAASFPDAEFVPFRADHLFATSPLAAAAARVLINESTGAASDHYPVLAELRAW